MENQHREIKGHHATHPYVNKVLAMLGLLGYSYFSGPSPLPRC